MALLPGVGFAMVSLIWLASLESVGKKKAQVTQGVAAMTSVLGQT